MVTAVTSLGRSGLADWVMQRVTAVVLLTYTLLILFVVFVGNNDYASWKGLFDQTWMKVYSLAAILSIAIHAWIGLWSVSTDYFIERVLTLKVGPAVGQYANLLRWGFQSASAIVLFTYVVWGIQILWG